MYTAGTGWAGIELRQPVLALLLLPASWKAAVAAFGCDFAASDYVISWASLDVVKKMFALEGCVDACPRLRGSPGLGPQSLDRAWKRSQVWDLPLK